jgi:hypothetical protein
MKKAVCLLLVLGLAGAAWGAGPDSDMANAAKGFYTAYESLGPINGLLDAKARARLEPFVSPALERALSAAAMAQKGFQTANKNAPPVLEGDIFTSHFEGATSFKVGGCQGGAKTAQCAALLTYQKGKAPPLQWTDTLYLVKTDGGWRVDDIGYGGQWRFANQGRLRATLAVVSAAVR